MYEKNTIMNTTSLIIDKATGFDLKKELDNLLAMDFWSREQIEADQEHKFEKLSSIAARSDYYQKFKGKSHSEYPLMHREDFKANHDSIRTNFRKAYNIQHTSGSTGYPVTLLISKEMLQAKRASHLKMLHWFGLRRESREFKIGGTPKDWKTFVYYYLRNKVYIDSFRIRQENSLDIIRRYNRFRPELLYGYPSAIYNFMTLARQKGMVLHHPVVIATHGENLYPGMKKSFQQGFPGVNVVNQYWATEANIGVSCPEGNVHLDEDAVICEVINTDEQGVGDLVVTNLYSYDLPIIRYKIGDRVKLSEKACKCGRKTRVIERIEGRISDQVKLPDGRIIPVTAFYFSKYGENLLAYQLAYFKSDALMEFRYIPVDPGKPIDEKGITGYLNNDYGLKTRFVKIHALEYTPGGKFKKVINI